MATLHPSSPSTPSSAGTVRRSPGFFHPHSPPSTSSSPTMYALPPTPPSLPRGRPPQSSTSERTFGPRNANISPTRSTAASSRNSSPTRPNLRSAHTYSPMMAIALGMSGAGDPQTRPQLHSTTSMMAYPPLSGPTKSRLIVQTRPRGLAPVSAPSTPRAFSGRGLFDENMAPFELPAPRAASAESSMQGCSPLSRPGTPLKRERERDHHSSHPIAVRGSSAFRSSPGSSPGSTPQLTPATTPLSTPSSPLLRAANATGTRAPSSVRPGRDRASSSRHAPRSHSHTRTSSLPQVMKVALPALSCPAAASAATVTAPTTYFTNVVATVTPGSGTSSTVASPMPLPMGRLPAEVPDEGYFAWSTGVDSGWLNSDIECGCACDMASAEDESSSSPCECGKGDKDDGGRARKLLRGCLEAEEERITRTSRRNSSSEILTFAGRGPSRSGSIRSSPSEASIYSFFSPIADMAVAAVVEHAPASIPLAVGSATLPSRDDQQHPGSPQGASSYVSFSSLNCPPPSPPASPAVDRHEVDSSASKKKGWVWG